MTFSSYMIDNVSRHKLSSFQMHYFFSSMTLLETYVCIDNIQSKCSYNYTTKDKNYAKEYEILVWVITFLIDSISSDMWSRAVNSQFRREHCSRTWRLTSLSVRLKQVLCALWNYISCLHATPFTASTSWEERACASN